MPKKTCQLIIDSGNDYVIAVKDNQPKLHRHIKRVAALRSPASRYIATEKTRDRLTTRTVEVFHDLNGIDLGWTGIKSLIRVERVGTRGRKQYHEVVCYISSLIRTAQEFACGIRGHWSIENCLHWVKDVVLDEDDSTIRLGNAPANLSVIRAIAQGALRRAQSLSIYSVVMVILPSQLLIDFSLMILTNFLPLWNETALPLCRRLGAISCCSTRLCDYHLCRIKS